MVKFKQLYISTKHKLVRYLMATTTVIVDESKIPKTNLIDNFFIRRTSTNSF